MRDSAFGFGRDAVPDVPAFPGEPVAGDRGRFEAGAGDVDAEGVRPEKADAACAGFALARRSGGGEMGLEAVRSIEEGLLLGPFSGSRFTMPD